MRMGRSELGLRRLAAQGVGRAREAPAAVVRRLAAVQGQDELASRWALGVRSEGVTEAEVVKSAARGDFLRTHALRGTWQLVAPEDLHWVVKLVGPTLLARSANRYRQLGLDAPSLRRAASALERALAQGASLTRAEAAEVYRRARVAPDGQRLSHLLQHAELECLTCTGPLRGKQVTVMALDARVRRKSRAPSNPAAELARRYFVSRGPATVADFYWWSGLPAALARAAHAAVRDELDHETVQGVEYWSGASPSTRGLDQALLLPAFDEFLISYQERSAVLDPLHVLRLNTGGGLLKPCVVVDGCVVGIWKRTLSPTSVRVVVETFSPASAALRGAVDAAAARYGQFLGREVRLSFR